MYNISIRQQRFLKLWAKNFIVFLLALIGVVALLTGFVLGFKLLLDAYGPEIMLVAVLMLVPLIGIGSYSYAHSKRELLTLEREENRTLDLLKKDYSESAIDKRAHKYYNILYGTTNNGVKK